eukprot:4547234-Prymnesium_polylepis.1
MRKLSVARRGTHLADKLSAINATSDKLTSSSGESERHPSGASDALPAVEVGGDLTVLGRTFQLGASSGEETSTQPRISILDGAKRLSHGDQVELRDEDIENFVFFEGLFFFLDSESDGTVSTVEAHSLLNCLAIKHSPKDCDDAVRRADRRQQEKLTRYKFCGLCVNVLLPYPMAQLKMAMDNFMSARQVAGKIDNVAAWPFPVIYTFVLVLLFVTEFKDDYLAYDGGNRAGGNLFDEHVEVAQPFQGFGDLSIKDASTVLQASTSLFLMLVVVTASRVSWRIKRSSYWHSSTRAERQTATSLRGRMSALRRKVTGGRPSLEPSSWKDAPV